MGFGYRTKIFESSSPYFETEHLMKLESDGLTIAKRDLSAQMKFNDMAGAVVAGGSQDEWLGVGSSVIKSIENNKKTLIYKFSQTINGLEMEVDVTYKVDQEVENEGIQAGVFGDMGFEKDRNIHVEGDAIVAGFLEEYQFGDLSQQFYSGDTTDLPFGLYTDHEQIEAHHLIDENANHYYIGKKLRKAGENRSMKVTILNDVYPVRILTQPDGRDMTFTSAVHPDGQTVDSLRAVMFGSSDKTHPYYGEKGIISRGIKMTYGAFAKSGSNSTGHHIGFLDEPELLDLYLEMQDNGIDIAPHSILPDKNEVRQDAIDYLPYYKQHFNSRVWIDHHLGSGQRTIGTASLGWNEESLDYYVMDLMDEQGYDYFWVYNAQQMRNRNQLIENRFGFDYNLVYQNPNVTRPSGEPFWMFRNTSLPLFRDVLRSNTPKSWVDEWIEQCGVVTTHEYYGRDIYEGLTHHRNNPNLISDKFDNLLAYIQQKKASGQIWNPTMSEFCDYFIKLRKISVKAEKNKFIVTNNNEGTVNGCSFLIGGKHVEPQVMDQEISYKHVSRGTICWTDIPVGKTVITY